MFIPIDGWTLILKNGGKWNFSYKTKESIHLSQKEEWICGTRSLKERRLLCESMFIPIERWTSILKMATREVFLMKPKHQYHLSQRGERVYDAQSWNEMRLLSESMFIPIERHDSILKLLARVAFLVKPKHQYHSSNRGECVYDAQSWKQGRLVFESMFIPIERQLEFLKL